MNVRKNSWEPNNTRYDVRLCLDNGLCTKDYMPALHAIENGCAAAGVPFLFWQTDATAITVSKAASPSTSSMAIVAGPSSGGTTSMSGTLVTTSRPSSATSLPDQITTSSSVQTNPAQATVGSQGNLAANSTKSHSLSTGAAAGIAF